MQRRLTETGGQVSKYEKEIKYLNNEVKTLKNKIIKIEIEKEHQTQTLQKAEESLVNTELSKVKLEK